MKSADIISLVMSLLGVVSFCAVFTILFGKYVKANVKETKEGKRDIELIDREITEQDVKAKRRKKAGMIISNILFYGFLALITPAFAFAGENACNDSGVCTRKYALFVSGKSPARKTSVIV